MSNGIFEQKNSASAERFSQSGQSFSHECGITTEKAILCLTIIRQRRSKYW